MAADLKPHFEEELSNHLEQELEDEFKEKLDQPRPHALREDEQLVSPGGLSLQLAPCTVVVLTAGSEGAIRGVPDRHFGASRTAP